MGTGIVKGHIDQDIRFCPYCGERLSMISLFFKTECEGCGRAFYVIDGRDLQSTATEEDGR